MSTRTFPRNNEALRSKENVPHIVPEPIPVDARTPRFKDIEIPDISMKEPESQSKPMPEKKPITLQDYKDRPKPAEEKNSEANPEQARTGPRQSELSTQFDSRGVMNEILKTSISLPLGEILGVSRELSNNLQDIIRYKNPISLHQ